MVTDQHQDVYLQIKFPQSSVDCRLCNSFDISRFFYFFYFLNFLNRSNIVVSVVKPSVIPICLEANN